MHLTNNNTYVKHTFIYVTNLIDFRRTHDAANDDMHEVSPVISSTADDTDGTASQDKPSHSSLVVNQGTPCPSSDGSKV
jgi:hypothetical protein